MKKKSTKGKNPRASSPWYFLSPLLFLGCFETYLLTLSPAFPNDDSAETITAGITLGLQHPPGYALSALFSRIQSFLPIGSPSFGVNLGSALWASLAVVLLAWITYSLLKFLFGKNSQNDGLFLFCAVTSGLLLAFSPTYWRNSLGAKGGIYLLGICLQLALATCLLRLELFPSLKNNKWVLLCFFLFGLGFSNHWETQVVFLPAFLVFFFLASGEKQGRLQGSILAKGLCLFLLAASPLLYLPLRAHLHPVLNLGAPDSFSNFMADLSRSYVAFREIGLGGVFLHLLDGSSTIGQFLDLFRLILKAQGRPISGHLLEGLGLFPLSLAALGVLAWLRSQERRMLLFLLLSYACLLAALLTALRVPDDPQVTWMLDNFLMPGDWIVLSLAAVGMAILLSRLRQSRPSFSLLAFLVLGALPFLMFFNSFEKLNADRQTLPYDYGVNLLKSLPRNSVFFAEGDPDYFSLYYLQNVKHLRSDVRMIPTFTLFESWGVAQVERFQSELDLTAAAQNFPDHFARIIYSISEIVKKNKDNVPIAFSYPDGAFHRYYLAQNPSLLFRKSGVILEIDSAPTAKGPWLDLSGLRARHLLDCPSNNHPSLGGIWNVYQKVGFSP